MKTITLTSLFTLSVFSVFILSSCRRDVRGCTDPNAINYNNTATYNDGSCQYEGSVVFWHDENVGAITTVYISGYSNQIALFYPGTAPTCGDAGCATFVLPRGNYSYTATTGPGGYFWSGTVTVYTNDCSDVLLIK